MYFYCYRYCEGFITMWFNKVFLLWLYSMSYRWVQMWHRPLYPGRLGLWWNNWLWRFFRWTKLWWVMFPLYIFNILCFSGEPLSVLIFSDYFNRKFTAKSCDVRVFENENLAVVAKGLQFFENIWKVTRDSINTIFLSQCRPIISY